MSTTGGRLHIRIQAQHRPVKGMTHESLMSGVCVQCAVLAGKVLENNTVGV